MDRAKLRKWLKDEHGVDTAYMFMGYMPEQQEMYTFFQNIGYTLVFRPVITTKDGVTKGNIDAELVLQTMIDYDKYKKAVIITGDGDFACLVTYLYTKNKLKSLVVPNKRRYSDLLNYAAKEKIEFISAMKRKFQYKPTRAKPKTKVREESFDDKFYV